MLRIIGKEKLSEEQNIAAEQILAIVDEWRNRLSLDKWDTELTFLPKLKDGESDDDGCCTWADTYVHWAYQIIKITFYAHSIDKEKSPFSIMEEGVLHELGHAVVNPMEHDDPSAREGERTEFVVTNLAKILLRMKYESVAT